MITIMSEMKIVLQTFKQSYNLPMIQYAEVANLTLPARPRYLDRHPADQTRATYSIASQLTKIIS
jgi:hypothetical protein